MEMWGKSVVLLHKDSDNTMNRVCKQRRHLKKESKVKGNLYLESEIVKISNMYNGGRRLGKLDIDMRYWTQEGNNLPNEIV